MIYVEDGAAEAARKPRPTFGSLFAGIGGMDLGLERAGMKCKWQVEIDDYARRVLEKHWPHVRRWDDVRTFPPEGEWGVDLIAGGFPCQDISNAGKREGIEGKRSGLWAEFARIIGVVRPRYVLVENVAALLSNGMGRVLGDLATLGFDAEWDVIPAAAFGAPHVRERLFVFAHVAGERTRSLPARRRAKGERKADVGRHCSATADVNGERRRSGQQLIGAQVLAEPANGSRLAADARGPRLSPPQQAGLAQPKETSRVFRGPIAECDWWAIEPGLVRMVHGVPKRVDRIRGLGNAVVPQVAEWIGRRIMEVLC